jgi:hypothetical protein
VIEEALAQWGMMRQKKKNVGHVVLADAGQMVAGLAVRDTGCFNSVVFYGNIMSYFLITLVTVTRKRKGSVTHTRHLNLTLLDLSKEKEGKMSNEKRFHHDTSFSLLTKPDGN